MLFGLLGLNKWLFDNRLRVFLVGFVAGMVFSLIYFWGCK